MPAETHPAPVRVVTSQGPVRGSRAGGIDRFLGIRYAKAPTGDRRFALPEPVDPWSDEVDATAFGPTAPQSSYPGALGALLTVPAIAGDEVLTVNVWAPAGSTGAPVVLWLHGGALERGASAQSVYDGTTFARDGVVFVSANYRLGVEGFSVLAGAPANLGLRDAAAALAWVHREIATFGGDPARITLMGESAGGALVAALLTHPPARPLIAGAIIQSGPLDASSPASARRVSDAIARRLKIPATCEAFAAVPVAELLRARAELSAGANPLGGAPAFELTLDPDSLPITPAAALTRIEIPLLIGTNTDEYRLWFAPDALARIGRLKSWAAQRAMRIPRKATREVRTTFPSASPGEVLGQLVTDRILRAPATRLARARTAPTYLYEFAWRSPVRDLRAAHALEIGFAFDRLDHPEARRLAGPDAPAQLARDMHASWVAFVHDGDPGWPRFGMDRLTRVWDTHSRDEPQRRQGIVDALG